jgi:hypothetical protein
MPDHNYFANLIWQIADLLRGPYRPPQYERVMLPMTVLRRFDCVLAPAKPRVLAEHAKRKGGKLEGDALDTKLNDAAGQRFHNHSPLDFEKLKGDPDNIEKHLVSYIKGFSKNVRDIFDFFEFENEIERMREANILYLVVSKFCDVDLHPSSVPNEQMGLIFENLIRRFNELANETAGDHFTPRDVIRADGRTDSQLVELEGREMGAARRQHGRPAHADRLLQGWTSREPQRDACRSPREDGASRAGGPDPAPQERPQHHEEERLEDASQESLQEVDRETESPRASDGRSEPAGCDPNTSPAKVAWEKAGITPRITDVSIEIDIT